MMRITVAIERITMVMKMTVTSLFAVGKAEGTEVNDCVYDISLALNENFRKHCHFLSLVEDEFKVAGSAVALPN